MKGKGVSNVNTGKPGDLYVQVNLEVPVKLNKEQKDLIRKFGETTTEGYSSRRKFADTLKKLFN